VKIALFGGTFDPIHRGHVELARAAADAFDLDEVWLIPSGSPPHKRSATEAGYEHRYQMVALACAADPRLKASRLEAPEEGREQHYSIDTIHRVLAQEGQNQPLYFLLGSDAFAEITTWHRWREVVELVEFIVVTRPGSELSGDAIPKTARLHWLRDVRIPISSSEVREKLRAGQPAADCLTPEVAAYIAEQGLYGPHRVQPLGNS